MSGPSGPSYSSVIEIPDRILFASTDSESGSEPLIGNFSAEQLEQERNNRRTTQMWEERSRAREAELLALVNRQAEAPFRGMPPLPPRLPEEDRPILESNYQIKKFYKACTQGNLQVVQKFAETSAWNGQHYLQRGLNQAAEVSQVEVARYLITKGAQLTSDVLLCACRQPTLSFFKFLVEEQNWHPNQSVFSGNVALNACLEDEELLLYLLSKGADPNLGPPVVRNRGAPTDRMSGWALNLAASSCEPRTFDLLLENGAKLEYATPIHSAAMTHSTSNDRRTMIQHLLDIGVNINGHDWSYHRSPYRPEGTPLSATVTWGNRSAAELLLQLGASPDTTETRPAWFRDIVARTKRAKGEDTFWRDVHELKEKGEKQKVAYQVGQ